MEKESAGVVLGGSGKHIYFIYLFIPSQTNRTKNNCKVQFQTNEINRKNVY